MSQRQIPYDIPLGTEVIGHNGQRLGTVHQVHPHYVVVKQDGSPHASLEIPSHAILNYDGKLHVSVSRDASTVIDEVETAEHELEEE